MADKDERDWLDLVHQIPCVVCLQTEGKESNAAAHHIREDQGVSKRAKHFLVAALCPEHHQGGQGIHTLGRRVWEARYGTELDAMSATVRGVLRLLRGRHGNG